MARKLSLPLSAAALVGTLIAASPAAAATVTDCEGIAPALETESTVLLAQGLDCTGSWDLPPDRSITLEGAGTGATLRGDGESRILSGFGHGTVVIRNLTFTNGSTGGSGGAIYLAGSRPVTIAGSTFTDNSAGNYGGAVRIEEETFVLQRSASGREGAGDAEQRATLTGNTFGGEGEDDANDSGRSGGALSLEVPGDVTLSGNTFTGNHGYQSGGGANVFFCGAATVTGNTFEDNEVDSFSVATRSASGLFGGRAEGGGLAIEGGQCFFQQPGSRDALEAPPAPNSIEQSGNAFRANVVDTDTEGSGRGGGEFVRGAELDSTDDTFHANAIAPGTGGTGGGLAFFDGYDGDGDGSSATLRNFVATANTMEFGEGGGVAFDGFFGGSYSIVHATIAGNAVGEGQGSGVWGARGQALTLDNSIVHGNTGAEEELAGFSGFEDERAATGAVVTGIEVAFSDACDASGAPLAGEGNICADPKLTGVAGGDVHQTAASPTIDAASEARSAGLTKDYEGQDRPLGYRSSAKVPDMGADEAPAPAPVVTPATPQPAAPAAGGVLGTQAKSCASRRSFRIKLRNRGQKVVKATVIVNGKQVKVLTGKRLTSRVNLRGLPKGRYSVRIRLRLANGKTISGVRKYYTCRPGRKSGPPPV